MRESLYAKYRGFIAQITGGRVQVNRLLSESGQRLSSVVASFLVRLMHSGQCGIEEILADRGCHR